MALALIVGVFFLMAHITQGTPGVPGLPGEKGETGSTGPHGKQVR